MIKSQILECLIHDLPKKHILNPITNILLKGLGLINLYFKAKITMREHYKTRMDAKNDSQALLGMNTNESNRKSFIGWSVDRPKSHLLMDVK